MTKATMALTELVEKQIARMRDDTLRVNASAAFR